MGQREREQRKEEEKKQRREAEKRNAAKTKGFRKSEKKTLFSHLDTPRPSSTLNSVRRGTTALTAPPSTTASTLSSVICLFLIGRKGKESERERKVEGGG